MKRMYAPWRDTYTKKASRNQRKTTTKETCVFCQKLKDKEGEAFIIKRFKHNSIILNKFPYNAGHLLIISIQHKASLEALSKPARSELMELISQSTSILKKTLHCDGINVGINLGKAAGSSIPSHLHIHVLPRWYGDTNFLPTLAETKQISIDLYAMCEQLTKAFAAT